MVFTKVTQNRSLRYSSNLPCRDVPVIPFPAVATAAAVSSRAAFSAAERNVPPTVNAVAWLIVIATRSTENFRILKIIVVIIIQKLCNDRCFPEGVSSLQTEQTGKIDPRPCSQKKKKKKPDACIRPHFESYL